jgi:hypothetical protein
MATDEIIMTINAHVAIPPNPAFQGQAVKVPEPAHPDPPAPEGEVKKQAEEKPPEAGRL